MSWVISYHHIKSYLIAMNMWHSLIPVTIFTSTKEQKPDRKNTNESYAWVHRTQWQCLILQTSFRNLTQELWIHGPCSFVCCRQQSAGCHLQLTLQVWNCWLNFCRMIFATFCIQKGELLSNVGLLVFQILAYASTVNPRSKFGGRPGIWKTDSFLFDFLTAELARRQPPRNLEANLLEPKGFVAKCFGSTSIGHWWQHGLRWCARTWGWCSCRGLAHVSVRACILFCFNCVAPSGPQVLVTVKNLLHLPFLFSGLSSQEWLFLIPHVLTWLRAWWCVTVWRGGRWRRRCWGLGHTIRFPGVPCHHNILDVFIDGFCLCGGKFGTTCSLHNTSASVARWLRLSFPGWMFQTKRQSHSCLWLLPTLGKKLKLITCLCHRHMDQSLKAAQRIFMHYKWNWRNGQIRTAAWLKCTQHSFKHTVTCAQLWSLGIWVQDAYFDRFLARRVDGKPSHQDLHSWLLHRTTHEKEPISEPTAL